MEYGLGLPTKERHRASGHCVLILLLMEYGLGQAVPRTQKVVRLDVLILLLMEYGLGLSIMKHDFDFDNAMS